jgi:hypothetical protein
MGRLGHGYDPFIDLLHPPFLRSRGNGYRPK